MKSNAWIHLLALALAPALAHAGEADLVVPELGGHTYLGGLSGTGLLGWGW